MRAVVVSAAAVAGAGEQAEGRGEAAFEVDACLERVEAFGVAVVAVGKRLDVAKPQVAAYVEALP